MRFSSFVITLGILFVSAITLGLLISPEFRAWSEQLWNGSPTSPSSEVTRESLVDVYTDRSWVVGPLWGGERSRITFEQNGTISAEVTSKGTPVTIHLYVDDKPYTGRVPVGGTVTYTLQAIAAQATVKLTCRTTQ